MIFPDYKPYSGLPLILFLIPLFPIKKFFVVGLYNICNKNILRICLKLLVFKKAIGETFCLLKANTHAHTHIKKTFFFIIIYSFRKFT